MKGAVKTYKSDVFDAVFRPCQINPALLQAGRRVFNTDFEPYVSSGDEEEATEPEFFRTSEGLRVSRKMRKFYTDVPVPVQDLAPSVAASGEIKRSKHPIGTREMACMMMANKNSLAHTAATLGIPKSTVHDYYKTYCNTGRSHKIERKKPHVDLLSKEHKWAIRKWLKRDPFLELGNIKTMLKSAFGVNVSVSYVYRIVRDMKFSWRKLGVSPYNRNSPANIELRGKYDECFQDLKELGNCTFFFVYESSFGPHLRNERGYVTKGSKDAVAERRSVRAQAYSMVALLGPKGLDMYQMIKGSHNSGTFLNFLNIAEQYIRLNYTRWANIIVIDNVALHKTN